RVLQQSRGRKVLDQARPSRKSPPRATRSTSNRHPKSERQILKMARLDSKRQSRLTADRGGGSLKESGLPMMRYLAARHYLSFGGVACGLAGFCGWLGLGWAPGFIPCALFLLSGAALIYMAYRPAIEIHPHHLAVGARTIHWLDIRRVDHTGWVSIL